MTASLTLNPSIVGQAEKAHNAVLFRVLDGTGIDETQWICLVFVARNGGRLPRTDLATRVTSDAFRSPDAVEAAIDGLVARGLLTADADALVATPAATDFVRGVRTQTDPIVERAYSAVSAEDLATAARVLAAITARLGAELAGARPA